MWHTSTKMQLSESRLQTGLCCCARTITRPNNALMADLLLIFPRSFSLQICFRQPALIIGMACMREATVKLGSPLTFTKSGETIRMQWTVLRKQFQQCDRFDGVIGSRQQSVKLRGCACHMKSERLGAGFCWIALPSSFSTMVAGQNQLRFSQRRASCGGQ